jgi:hypothetical protein
MGRMLDRSKNLLDVIDTTKFWVAVAFISTLFVFSYAWANGREDVKRNAEHLALVQITITHLCETIHVIEAFHTQRAHVITTSLQENAFNQDQERLLRQLRALDELAAIELSDARSCQEVE